MLSLKTKDFSDDYLIQLEDRIKDIEKSIQGYKAITHEPQIKDELSIDEIKDLFKNNLQS